MCNERDRAYFRHRRDEELQRAASENDESLRVLHERWAELYRKRLMGEPWR